MHLLPHSRPRLLLRTSPYSCTSYCINDSAAHFCEPRNMLSKWRLPSHNLPDELRAR